MEGYGWRDKPGDYRLNGEYTLRNIKEELSDLNNYHGAEIERINYSNGEDYMDDVAAVMSGGKPSFNLMKHQEEHWGTNENGIWRKKGKYSV